MTDRRPIIAANWKMHNSHLEAIQTTQKLSYLLDRPTTEDVEVVICPPFTALRSVQTLIDSDRLSFELGAQDVHWEEKGAFTGEVSPTMLEALKVRYVIIGHSERREHFGETDPQIAKKAKSVFAHGMTPILCVGETLDEREGGRTQAKVEGQVREDLGRTSGDEARRIVIAYEPIWAIGTGRSSTPEDAGEVAGAIRRLLATMFDAEVGEAVRIQYGGSVKAGNIRDFMAHPEIDGALVGGASLDPEEFALIVRYRG
ncbi:MAG: triose-phosphate isomerase [Actinomycetota bacterium]